MAGPLGKKVTIGKLRQRVTIQTPAGVSDEFGGRVTGWTDIATVRAEVLATGGLETLKNGTVQAKASHRVRIRYRSDVGAKCRLLWLVSPTVSIPLNIVACPPTVGAENIIELWCLADS